MSLHDTEEGWKDRILAKTAAFLEAQFLEKCGALFRGGVIARDKMPDKMPDICLLPSRVSKAASFA